MGREKNTENISMYGEYSERLASLWITVIMIANGDKETIEMQGKRSMEIYKEIMSAIRAVDLKNEFKVAKEKAEIMAKPYLNWV